MSDLYVDATAPPGGNGSKNRPYNIIGKAVTAAPAGTTIHVAKGQYREDLKTVFIKPGVWLKGSTVLRLDDRGLPTGETDHAATVKPPTAGIPKNEAVFRIQAENVEITGLMIDGKADVGESPGSLVIVDGAQGRVDGFKVKGNVLVNAGTLNAGTTCTFAQAVTEFAAW